MSVEAEVVVKIGMLSSSDFRLRAKVGDGYDSRLCMRAENFKM